MRKACFAFAIAAALVATPAFAQDVGPSEGDYEFQLGAGGSSGQEFGQSQFDADITLGYYLDSNWMVNLRQEASYSDVGQTVWNGSTRAGVAYHFDAGEVRPFVGADLGYVYGDSVNDSFIADGSAGLKWYVKPETFIFGRADYQFFFDDANDANEALDDGRWLYTAGIGFNF